MKYFHRQLISLALSTSLIFSSLAPAWAKLNTADTNQMKHTVAQALALVDEANKPVAPANNRCGELWKQLQNTLGSDDEGMFLSFCEAWLYKVNTEICQKQDKEGCQYAQRESTILGYYQKQRATQEQNIEIALANRQNIAGALLKWLDKDQDATCKEVAAQRDNWYSVYGDLLPELIIGQGGDFTEERELYAKLLRAKVSGNDKKCYPQGKTLERERAKYVTLLGMVGSSKEDAEALGSYLSEKDSKEGGPGADVIFSVSTALMEMNQYEVFQSTLNRLFSAKREGCPSNYGIGISDIVRGVHALSRPDNAEFACGWENSWFKVDGFENAENAWAQLGQQIGAEARKGNPGAQKLLKGVNDKNLLFDLGVIVSGQHPSVNKSNSQKAATMVTNLAPVMMSNLPPPTRAYVRDGLYTIYTTIAGKSPEQAAQVPLWKVENSAPVIVGTTVGVTGAPITAGNNALMAIYVSHPGLYPAGSKESNALMEAEEAEENTWAAFEVLGDVADMVLLVVGGAELLNASVKGAAGAWRLYRTAYKEGRAMLGMSKGAAVTTGARMVGAAARLKAIGAWRNISYSVSSFVYGSQSERTLALGIKAAANESRLAAILEGGLESEEALLVRLAGKTPRQIEAMAEQVANPEVKAALNNFVTKLRKDGVKWDTPIGKSKIKGGANGKADDPSMPEMSGTSGKSLGGSPTPRPGQLGAYDRDALTGIVSGADLPRVGAQVGQLGTSVSRIDVGTVQVIFADENAQTIFMALADSGRINSAGLNGWLDVMEKFGGKAGFQAKDLANLFSDKGGLVVRNGKTIIVPATRNGDKVLVKGGGHMEQAIREFQYYVSENDKLAKEFAGSGAFKKVFSPKGRDIYTSDVEGLTDAVKTQLLYKQQLAVLKPNSIRVVTQPIKVPRAGGKKGDPGVPGAPKHKIIRDPVTGQPKAITEIEWQTWDAKNTGALARNAGLNIPEPLDASGIKNATDKTKGHILSRLFKPKRREDLLAWGNERLNMKLSSDYVQRVRIRMTKDEIFGAKGDLLPTPHVHYEILLNDGTQLNYIQLNYAVKLEKIDEVAMRNIFAGKGKTWSYFGEQNFKKMFFDSLD